LFTGVLKKTLTGHTGLVQSLTILKNGDLASGSSDNTIKIWDSEEGSLKQTLSGHSDQINSLTTLPNGDLTSASADSTIKIWKFSI